MEQYPVPPHPPIGVGDSVDLHNVQGDILLGGFPKKVQNFYFFTIDGSQVQRFRANLSRILPFVCSGDDLKQKRQQIEINKQKGNMGLVPMSLVNIAFSAHGLKKICDSLHISPGFGDPVFDKGMLVDAPNLGDRVAEWNQGFAQNNIDGVINIAGDNAGRIASELGIIKHMLEADKPNGPVHEAFTLAGHTRPGKEDGHEHFGFLDGVSQPAVPGVDTPKPLQTVYDGVGRLLMKHNHDDQLNFQTGQIETVQRPDWTRDGSIMCFRKLDQLVPEFHAFLRAFPVHIADPGAPPTLGSDLLGARMVGRWPSGMIDQTRGEQRMAVLTKMNESTGAPLELTPFRDNTSLAGNNEFDFRDDASRCPFSAHIRKTNPRNDTTVDNRNSTHAITRRGIQFGDEVTPYEASSNRSDPGHVRGLLFVCYQSNLSNGFSFMQQRWANNPAFKPLAPGVPGQVGFDPIIGQSLTGPTSASVNLGNPTPPLILARWVISRGGEYFFVPSMSTLRMFGSG
ncbi:hypothetical protein DV737_g867, partial [Chaetothyriales sp. CBS 132003]